MITQLFRHLTSSPHDAGAKGDIFRSSIHPKSRCHGFYIFGVTRGGGGGWGWGCQVPVRQDQKRPV